MRLVYEGHSLFFSGSAGTGKSYLLSAILKSLSTVDGSCCATSSTGITATAIGGVTIHSWSGIGAGEEAKEKLLARVQRSREAQDRWQSCQVLIIDEGLSALASLLFLSHVSCSGPVKQCQCSVVSFSKS